MQNGVYGDYEYAYDENGNITAITDRSSGTAKHISYVYDALNQLVRENNEIENKTYTWTYDTCGNIQSKSTYAYTTGTLGTATNTVTYGYNSTNADLLISYNGQSITYGAIGNPLNYRGMSMSWTQGRRLASLTKNGVTSTYTYNPDGIRTSKTVGGNTTSYRMIDGTVTGFTQSNYRVEFLFDNAGRCIGFTLTIAGFEIPYYYEFNAQGDVVALYDKYGDLYATYRYDAWGKLLGIYDDEGDQITDGIAVINPVRYRGYFYDTETGLYYLNSRYYDPETGRFINADDVEIIDGANDHILENNLFVYCFNNPINMSDDNGAWPKWAKKMVAAVAVVAVVAVVATVLVATAGTATAPIICTAAGAAKGAAIGAATGALSGAVTGAATGAISHRVTTGSWKGAGEAALNGAADGALSGAITGAITGAVTGAVTSPYCFVAGTAVLTAAGSVAIEEIRAGDYVWAWDEDTGDVALKRVVETYINETDELVHVFVGGEEIVATPSHPFYSPENGWIKAGDLRAGDVLVLVDGKRVIVEKVQHELLETPVAVYNFQVEDYHTYYVGNVSILAHNMCKPTTFTNKTTSAFWKSYDKLPKSIKKAADVAFSKFKANPYQNGLNFEKLKGFNNLYSVRINDQYRAIGEMVGNRITWTKIIPHTYNLL